MATFSWYEKTANTVKNTTRQHGFTFIELIVSIAILGVLSAIAAPALVNLINHNQTKAASILFQDNLRQARYDSKTRSTSTIVFCAVRAAKTAKQRCVANNNRTRFSNGWQWFVDTNGDFQYRAAAGDTDILLGNTYEVDLNNINVAVDAVTRPIFQNRIVFNNGRPTIVRPTTFEEIQPRITFTDKHNRVSAVTFDVTGRATLRHED